MISIKKFREWIDADDKNEKQMEVIIYEIYKARCLNKDYYILFDGGAHTGFHTIRMLTLSGCAKVYAIEADPFMAEMLIRNIKKQLPSYLNKLQFINKALQKDPLIKNVAWKSSFTHHGRSSIVSRNGQMDSIWFGNPDVKYRQEMSIQATTIDEILRDEIRHLVFLKLDLEGADLFSLMGAGATLRYHRPIVAFENSIHSPKVFGFSIEQVLSYLKSIDYVLLSFVGDILNLENWCSLHFWQAWAVPREDIEWVQSELSNTIGRYVV